MIDNRIRQTFREEQRTQLLRAAERARLGQLYDDLDPDRSDRTPHYGPAGLGAAQHAIRYRCVLRFVYYGRERRLHPDDVFYSGGGWYVRGKEEGAPEEVKMFRLDRASEVEPDLPGTAGPRRDLPPPNRDPMRRSNFGPSSSVRERPTRPRSERRVVQGRSVLSGEVRLDRVPDRVPTRTP